jgi:hypothetical protein
MICAERLLTLESDAGRTSYWRHGERVYRLQEYEAVGFDIYGLPMGARWEAEWARWPELHALLTADPCSLIPVPSPDDPCRHCGHARSEHRPACQDGSGCGHQCPCQRFVE